MKPRAVLLLFLLVLAAPVAISSQKRPPARLPSKEDNLQWETARKGIEKNGEHITSAMWALTHGYSSHAKVDEAMRLLLVFLEAVNKNDPQRLRSIGGLEGFFSRYLRLLQSDDDMVAGFSARVLAVTAGPRFEPQILALLQQRDASFTDEWAYPPKLARGNAAFALSINGSDKHKTEIAQLLKSMNEYDRSGAVHALGRLKAIEYAGEIAALLLRKEFTFRRSESPIHALVQMGVAANFKKEIGQAIDEDYESEVQETAAFAIAHLRAVEYAPKIARFLEDDYRRGWAAKVLALLGAKEFAPQIARIAFGTDWLDQSAALLSLGILQAENYAPQISALMKSKDLSVSYDAALSLALMGGAGYEKEILARLSTNKTGKYVDEGELHPIVAEEAREIDQRVRATLQLFRSGKATGSRYLSWDSQLSAALSAARGKALAAQNGPARLRLERNTVTLPALIADNLESFPLTATAAASALAGSAKILTARVAAWLAALRMSQSPFTIIVLLSLSKRKG